MLAIPNDLKDQTKNTLIEDKQNSNVQRSLLQNKM